MYGVINLKACSVLKHRQADRYMSSLSYVSYSVKYVTHNFLIALRFKLLTLCFHRYLSQNEK